MMRIPRATGIATQIVSGHDAEAEAR